MIVPLLRRGGGDSDFLRPGTLLAISSRAHRSASRASCRGLAHDSAQISGVSAVAWITGTPSSRTHGGTYRGPAIHFTSVSATSAATSGRHTGDISVRPWMAIRPKRVG